MIALRCAVTLMGTSTDTAADMNTDTGTGMSTGEWPESGCWRVDEPAAAQGLPVILVSAAALVDADGRVLLSRHPVKPQTGKPATGKPATGKSLFEKSAAGQSMANLWVFPGGKMEPGETPERALIRELKEELDIDVTSSCLAPVAFASHGYDDFHLLMPLFACRVWKGHIQPREGQSLQWVRPVRMGDIHMPPANAPLVAVLRDLI